MHDKQVAAPGNTAVRVALWRALHVEVDSPPHVLRNRLEAGRSRRRMAQPSGHEPVHAALPRVHRGPRPLHRRSRRGTSCVDLGLGIPSFLRLVPVDFEAGDGSWERLAASGFDSGRPAVVASTGVSMYLTKDAILATLRQVAALAPGSTLAMTFLLPLELADPEVRPGLQLAEKGARASGTPFVSFFTPTEMLTLAREAGFREVQHVSAATLAQRYFAGRTDGFRPPNNSEELLVATT